MIRAACKHTDGTVHSSVVLQLFDEIDALRAKLAEPAEPVAVRYDFDGYGWRYIDNGSGSDWLERGMNWKDHELVYASPPTPAEVLKRAAEAACEAVAFNGGTVQMEAHVRAAIEGLK